MFNYFRMIIQLLGKRFEASWMLGEFLGALVALPVHARHGDAQLGSRHSTLSPSQGREQSSFILKPQF